MTLASALAALLFFAGLVLCAAAWLCGPAVWVGMRRWRVRRQPFAAHWREILRRRMPAFARLPADVQWRLRKLAQVLLAETPFIGCAGLVVDDEMRVLVAVQASLLLVNRGAGGFANLRQVLVYPDAFVVDRATPDAAGLVHATRRVHSGESWQQGQVVLSWADVLAGAADPSDGHNVVIHEFAHQLDQAAGPANGAPWQRGRARAAAWARVLGAEFEGLKARLARGESGLIDAYAATDPAEFFAVVSELFFERPAELAAAHGALYAELVRYYQVSPLQWLNESALLPR